jgi:hypothetical protein
MKEKQRQGDATSPARPTTPLASQPDPVPAPVVRPASGLYTARVAIGSLEQDSGENETGGAGNRIGNPRSVEELRLDVDGTYPQMVASGLVRLSLAGRIHWIANLQPAGPNVWAGGISYKNGAIASFPFTNVEVSIAKASPAAAPRRATVRLSGGGVPDRIRVLKYRSPHFHKVEFEYDSVENTAPVTLINTHDHPNRPGTLADEALTIEKVFQRAGFEASVSSGPSTIPLPSGSTWSDMEMHDAMQAFWSRFANRAQWRMWVLFASLHESGSSLGGIMFDDIGPNQRQGTALFLDSFIASAPGGDPNPAAWVRRMAFWTACHEMGHAFNLAHSWQKSLSSGTLGPWVPLSDEPEARSFMNYPFRVAGGQSTFFADFEFRFSDPELLFMRHAPGRFVQMGHAEWFDDHGFDQADSLPDPTFTLEVRVNRPRALFEFLEPVCVELKLTNASGQPQLLPDDILTQYENLTLIIKKNGRPARQFIPFARYCTRPTVQSMAPGDSIYESLFLSADRAGWGLAEPGNYRIQAALHLQNEDVVSLPLDLRIAPPRGYDEEFLAQDFFSHDVGRVLAFDGTQILTSASDTLREVTQKLPARRVTRHAHVALGSAEAHPYKRLSFADDSASAAAMARPETKIRIAPASFDEARKHLSTALTQEMEISAESLGHIDFKYYVDKFSELLAEQGERQQAAKMQNELHRVMTARGVLDRVLKDIKSRSEQFAGRAAGSRGA